MLLDSNGGGNYLFCSPEKLDAEEINIHKEMRDLDFGKSNHEAINKMCKKYFGERV
ncbi:hypothetical protein PENSUB_14140 [Penicillium subrubescens]|jgi:hypothetical protein|uniref:Uncharacterized protein n=1 Tax=Penicillium subrubescens TaxID=1316194 RepID=A0A1Q5UPH2_9EURO|nr:hypothetical protein PENSUB_14140 [Penicillium subrubescens]